MEVTEEMLAGLTEEDRKLLEGETIEEEPKEVEPPKEEPKEELTLETLQKQNETLAEQLKKFEEQTNNLNKALKEERYNNRTINQNLEDFKKQLQSGKEKKEVSFDDEPLEYTKDKLDQFDRDKQDFNAQLEQMKTLNEQQRFALHVKSMEETYKRTTPDYDDAFKYMVEFRKKELANYGITDEQQINQEIERNSFQLAAIAIQRGLNPADVLYKTAQQYGYKKAEAEVKLENKLEDIQKGQEKANKTLKNSEEDADRLTAEHIAGLEGEEFSKAFDSFMRQGTKKDSLLS